MAPTVDSHFGRVKSPPLSLDWFALCFPQERMKRFEGLKRADMDSLTSLDRQDSSRAASLDIEEVLYAVSTLLVFTTNDVCAMKGQLRINPLVSIRVQKLEIRKLTINCLLICYENTLSRLSINLSTSYNISIYLSNIYVSIYLSIYLLIYLSTYVYIHILHCTCIYYLSTYLSIFLPIYPSLLFLSINLSTIYLSICLLSIYLLSTYVPIYLSLST